MDQDYMNFINNLKLKPSAPAAIRAFQFADSIASIIEGGIEEGVLSYYKGNSNIVIQLKAETFCIRQPWLKYFLSVLKEASKVLLEKDEHGFCLKVFFLLESK